jgi:hypothetical protein
MTLKFNAALPLTDCTQQFFFGNQYVLNQSTVLPLMEPGVVYQSLVPILALMNPVHTLATTVFNMF